MEGGIPILSPAQATCRLLRAEVALETAVEHSCTAVWMGWVREIHRFNYSWIFFNT